jgi:hypothetical protein
LDFAFVPEFLAATSLLEPAIVCRTELKPFLTILGTRMRAIIDVSDRAANYAHIDLNGANWTWGMIDDTYVETSTYAVDSNE